MAEVAFERPAWDSGCYELVNYLNYLVDELEYILTNIDEENTTEAYENKEEK